MTNGIGVFDAFSHHVAAVQLIAPRQCKRDFAFRSVSRITRACLATMKAVVRDTGHAVVTLAYDTASEVPRVGDIWVMVGASGSAGTPDSDDLTLIANCKLWAPDDGGRIRIVGPETFDGHFVVSGDGTRLERRTGRPAVDLAAGIRRAEQRIAQLVRAGTAVPQPDTTLLLRGA